MDISDVFYIDILTALSKANVQFILVGGLAVSYHGYSRYTGDMDLWINPEEGNIDNLYQALEDIGYSPNDIEDIRFCRDIENPMPIKLLDDNTHLKIDLMTNTFQKQFTWQECFEMSNKFNMNGVDIHVVHINHLIYMKENTKRLDSSMKDLVDAEELKKIKKLMGGMDDEKEK